MRNRVGKLVLAEIGPERGREDELRISRLPQQKIGQPKLSRSADQQVELRKAVGGEAAFDRRLVNRRRVELPRRAFESKLARSEGDFGARPVVERHHEGQPAVGAQFVHCALEPRREIRPKGAIVADQAELDALLAKRVELALEIIAEQALEIRDLLFGPPPVFRGKGIERKHFDAVLNGSLQGPPNRFGARTMARHARQGALLRPASVPVHDDCHVARDGCAALARFPRLVRRRRGAHLPRISFSLASAASSISLIVSSVSFCTSVSSRLRSSSLI